MRLLLTILCIALPLRAQVPTFEEHVEVERLILDAYITDSRGNPVEGLTPEDLEVRIGGEVAEIEAVDWIPVEQRIVEAAGEEPVVMRQGRLLVLFFQTDFARNRSRVGGQMSNIPRAIRFLDVLNPSDLVAVVQFDSHLKVRCDFTNDREVLKETIERSLEINEREPVPPTDEISLLEHIDLEAAREAANVEKALWIVARGLNEIHGPKTLVLFGYGLGVYGGGVVSMRGEYGLARDMLESSRTTVFSLDITEADYHSLEVGMKQVSGDTGGFYARTYQFPSMAYERLANTLSGRYEIVLKRPNVRPGRHDVDVRVDRPEAFYVQVPGSMIVQ